MYIIWPFFKFVIDKMTIYRANSEAEKYMVGYYMFNINYS